MSHLLALLAIQPTESILESASHAGRAGVLGEVDFMGEEGGLGRCRGHDGHLYRFSFFLLIFKRANKPTVSLSSNRIFILAADVPAAALSPADTILVT